LTAREGILLHLLESERYRDDDILPESVTQPGIARALDTDRSYISFVISRMAEKKLLSQRLGRIEGARRKRKVYFLMEKGLTVAREIRDILSNVVLNCSKDGRKFEDTISVISENTGISPVRLVVMTEPGTNNNLDDWISSRVEREVEALTYIGPPVPENFSGRKEEIDLICHWLDTDSPLLQVIGIAGTGKTSLVGKAMKDCSDLKSSMIYLSMGSWSDDQSVITNISRELQLVGRESIAMLHKEKGHLTNDVFRNSLELEASRQPLLIVIDNVQFLLKEGKPHPLLEMIISLSSDDLKLILISRENIDLDPRSFLGSSPPMTLELSGLTRDEVKALTESRGIQDFNEVFEITAGHPLFLNLYIEHGCGEGSLETRRTIRTFIRKEVLECINRTERDIIDLISIFRHPISREDLFDMDAVDLMISESGLQSLLGGGLLLGDERSLRVHQLIGDILRDLMPRGRSEKLHRIIADHYREQMEMENEPIKDIAGRMIMIREYLHHLRACATPVERIYEIADLGEELMSRSMYEDLQVHTEELLDYMEKSREAGGIDPSLKTLLLIYNGWCRSVRGDWDEALNIYERARSTARDLGNMDLEGRCLNAVGSIHLRRGDPSAAGEMISKSIEMMEDKRSLCKARSNMAIVKWMDGELEDALKEVLISLDLAMFLNDAMGVSRGLINKGIILAQGNDLEGSRSAYDRAREICEREGFSQTLSIVHDNLGEVYREMGDLERSRSHFESSLELAESLGFRWQVAEATRNLASLSGEGPGRTGLFMKAEEIFRGLGDLKEVERTKKMRNGDFHNEG
jgi:tetratricopeptide (TPR) repeat protein